MRSVPSVTTEYLDLVQYTLRGNAKFARHAEEMWPRAQALGTPNSPGRMEHLICVVDADKLVEVLPRVGAVPPRTADVPSWHASAEVRFIDHLRERAEHPATVHGLVLRWAKESLTLAAYDRPATRSKLGIDPSHPGVQQFLAGCVPPPQDVADPVFTDHYQHPITCVDKLRKSQGLPAVGKGTSMDDVLVALTAADIPVVCQRVPDVDRLVALAWQLAMGAPAATAGQRAGQDK